MANCSECFYFESDDYYSDGEEITTFKCKTGLVDKQNYINFNQPACDHFRGKEGEWLRTPTSWVYCSICGEEPPGETNITSKYCPNCGAKMKENFRSDILESERIENEPELQMYIKKTEGRPNKYAYGEDWIEQALLMDDIQFDTEEEAIAWWEKYYGKGEPCTKN